MDPGHMVLTKGDSCVVHVQLVMSIANVKEFEGDLPLMLKALKDGCDLA